MSQLALPSPVSPPYSQHSPLIHHLHHQQQGLVHSSASVGRMGSSTSNGKRQSSDCNDNLTNMDPSLYGQGGKKSRKSGGEDHHHHQQHYSSGSSHLDGMKSSLDGNSSCRSTPLTPLSSKSGGSQNGSSSPSSPPFQQSFRTPTVQMTGPSDPSTAYAASYYQQPYYHPLYPNPQHHGYYPHHQGWTTDLNLHHPATAGVPTPLPPSTTPSLSSHAHNYLGPYPLTPDGSCNNNSITGSTAADVALVPQYNDKVPIKEDHGNHHHQQSQSTSVYSSSVLEQHQQNNEDGLAHSTHQEMSNRSSETNSARESLEYPAYKIAVCNTETHAPSYYTK